MESLRSAYTEAGQGHVFTFYDQLTPTEQSHLVQQLESISPSRINSIFERATASAASTEEDTRLEPPVLQTTIGNSVDSKRWNGIGLEAIRQNQVGVLLMAGGMGTRLGSAAPKGEYEIGLPSRKSLFQLQAERIKRLQELASSDAIIPWYIMTSSATRTATEAFFEKSNWFGLKEENVIFFEQGTHSPRDPLFYLLKRELLMCRDRRTGVLPCFTNDGKIYLETPGHIAVAPDGNGGIYAGLRSPLSSSNDATVLTDLARRGIKYLHAYCVDNCLVRVADPIFLGYCIEKGADCGAKVVKKLQPDEPVGVVALKNGKYGVVEYSEIPKALSESREEGEAGGNGEGELRFRAANIANHFYTLDFLTSVASFEQEMAYHIAHKKILYVDVITREQVKPSKPNGIKLELFVFDVFPFTKAMAVLEVDRATDFSPLKNAPGTGSDDPESSRRDLLKEQGRWLIEAGASIAEGVEVEVSPLVSYAGEGLESLKGKVIKRSGVLERIEDVDALC